MEKTILNYLLEKSSQAYLSINLNGEILDCNPKASELFGYSIHEIKALPITNLFLDNAQKLLFSDLLAEGEITSVVDAVGKNGKQFSLELSGKVIPDDKACDKRIVLLGQMSTKGARTSAMSEALEEDLGRVIESVNVGIVVHNEQDE
ncbi:MAG: PAS domain-containing protein, partial [Bdellovibrionaceae bacterium]|nr:PAS domain-containing protein [Pseudobdellovibrionaceae bacterium]